MKTIVAAASILLAGFAVAMAALPSSRERGVDDLSWLAGSWLEVKEGVETEEHWIEPKGDLMLAVSRTVTKSGKASFEFLRIAKTAAGFSYFASPGGAAPTEFPMVESSESKVVFENKKHDFPQRILYWLDDKDVLHVRIEGPSGGKTTGQEWSLERSD